MFEEVTRWVRTSAGIYRTTFRGRFADVDQVVLRWMRQLFAAPLELRVQDRAASHCLTSVEWARSLMAEFPNLRMEASDRTLFFLKASLEAGGIYFLEMDGTPLQYVKPPFVLPLDHAEPWWYPVNRFLTVRAKSKLTSLSLPAGLDAQPAGKPLRAGNWTVCKIPHIHPEALELAANDRRFQLRTWSVFDPTSEPCHVIRTMNILIPAYFTASQLQQGAWAVLQSLVEGGLWVVGRTHEFAFTNDATIFRKENGRFVKLEEVGKGLEIESIIRDLIGAY